MDVIIHALPFLLALCAIPDSADAYREWQPYLVTTLHHFTGPDDGAGPRAGVVFDSAGNLYGTTERGNRDNLGTVFQITPEGGFKTLYRFTGADGAEPHGGVILDNAGNLYGTTYGGGRDGNGTVFQITSAGILTTLHHFTGADDGAGPRAGVVFDSAGNLYGTTERGGRDDLGTVFQITPAGDLKTLHHFTYRDGIKPHAGVIFDNAGNLYGTTESNGNDRYGTVFQITSAGDFKTLHHFTYVEGEYYPLINGAYPRAGVVFDSAGNLYGTTEAGGRDGKGTVFQITSEGGFKTLCRFTGAYDGARPHAGVIFDNVGNLYGTTERSGNDGKGTVFQIRPEGDFETLHHFRGADGACPCADMIFDSAGNLYGTTREGGSGDLGTVFRILFLPSNLTPMADI